MIKKIKKLIKWWLEEQEKLCPNCGYYCSCNSAFCLPPETGKETKEI